jgi:predicted MFS family arabinose efflux permease
MTLRNVSIVLITTAILVACNIYTFIPLYGPISVYFGLKTEDVIWGSSIFTLLYAVGLLSFGPISERKGRKNVIVFGLLFSSAATGIVACAPNAASLYMARGVQGFALGSFAPVAFAYTFELFPSHQKTLVLALINSGFLIAGMLGQIMSGFIEAWFDWRFVFLFFSFVYAFLFILSWMILPKTPTKPIIQHRIWKTFFIHLTNLQLLKCYAITFSILLSFVSFYEGIASHFEQHASMNDSALMWIRAIGLIGVFLSLFTNQLINAFGEKRTLSFGLGLAVCSLLPLSFSSAPSLIAIVSIFFVGAISLLLPSIITLIGNLAVMERGTAISLYSFILLTGAGIGPLLVHSLSITHTMLVLICFFSIGFCLVTTIKSGH